MKGKKSFLTITHKPGDEDRPEKGHLQRHHPKIRTSEGEENPRKKNTRRGLRKARGNFRRHRKIFARSVGKGE